MGSGRIPTGDESAFQAILDHAPIMIDSFDERGQCVLWNRECERRLGWTQAEVAAMEDPIGAFYPDPADRRRVREAIGRCDGTFREYGVRAKNGSTRVQRWADFRLPSGAVISVGVDVTEQVEVEAQLRHAQKMDALGLLAGGIAHDFNNLLTVISANAEIVSRAERFGEASARRAANEITEATRRGSQLVSSLLAFGRKSPPPTRSVDVGPLVGRIAATLRRVLPETISFHVDVSAGGFVRADSGALEQVLLNLVNNARDAIEDSGDIHVMVRSVGRDRVVGTDLSTEAERFVELRVRDTGAGVPKDVIQRVFEPFFTTKGPGEGTGLGLTMVYAVVRQYGGAVDLESEVGKGTTVRAWLPQLDEVGKSASDIAFDGNDLPLGTERILVVEDDRAVRLALVRALERLRYTVVSASDGDDAIAKLVEADFDLILSDVVMPKSTGVDLVQRARELKSTVPIALTSGHAADYLDGIDEKLPLLRKPWTLAQLATFVRACLDASRLK